MIPTSSLKIYLNHTLLKEHVVLCLHHASSALIKPTGVRRVQAWGTVPQKHLGTDPPGGSAVNSWFQAAGHRQSV